MKFLPYILIAAITAIICYVAFHRPAGTEREKELESKIAAWKQADAAKAAQINFLTSEIETLKHQKEIDHEELLQAKAQTILYQKRYETYRLSPVLHYSGKQRDSVIATIIAERNSRQRKFGNPD